jgi:DNA adenine methylase
MNKSPLKWAGNKFRVLPHLLPLIGTPVRYCEPFGGSLSVALNVQGDEYILNDINQDLYSLYTNIDEDFILECSQIFVDENNSRERYLELRKKFNNEINSRERAKLFLYLNKHSFNGLCRYNSKGEFNVPYGKENKNSKTGKVENTKAHFPEKEMINFISTFDNKSVEFTNTTFSNQLLYSSLESGDVVYFDPPYIPISDTAYFTDYATEGFTHDQQIELAQLAESLASRGIKVIISNHDVPIARELYKNAQIYPIQVTRTISAKNSSRKKANELIAVYYCAT